VIHYLLWSNKHTAWWRPDGRGYTDDIAQAGAYTQEQAVRHVVQSSYCQDRNQVTLMVAAPPGWTPPAPDLEVFATGPLVDVLGAFFESRRDQALAESRLTTVELPGGES
jgi:hypothetical protein